MKLEDFENKDLDVEKFVPGANLELIIEGLVFMYMKGDLLMMRFPEADDHTLQISIKRNGLPYAGFSVPVGSLVEITHNGAVPAKENNFDGVLNIKTFHPKLKLQQSSDLQSSSRGLSIANAQVFPKGEKTMFEYWEITENTRGEPISKKRRADLEPSNGIEAIMLGAAIIDRQTANPQTKIKVAGAMPFETNLTYADNIKYTMRISNHCNKPDCEFRSDFHHYYNIFASPSLTNKFELYSVPTRGNRAPCNIVYIDSNPE